MANQDEVVALGTEVDVVIPVRMPQLNANDEQAILIGWHVGDGGQTVEGEPLCEIETSKAIGDLPSPASGVLRRMRDAGDTVGVGQLIAFIGSSLEEIDRQRSSSTDSDSTSDFWCGVDLDERRSSVAATAGAIDLARRHGVEICDVPADGKVRRADVECFVARQNRRKSRTESASDPGDDAGLPPALLELVTAQGELSAHQWSIAHHLAETQSRVVTASVAMDASVRSALSWIEAGRRQSRMVSLTPLILHAMGDAIRTHEQLACFRWGRRLFRYRSVDVAFTARSRDGRLYTPVVRRIDERTPDELATECARLAMAVFRGTIEPKQLTGGCSTLSVLDDHPVRYHVGLQNAWQSSVLTAGAVWERVELVDGQAVGSPTVTLVLTYDHGLMDGWQAATFLSSVKAAVEAIAPETR